MSTDIEICLGFQERVVPSTLIEELISAGWHCDIEGGVTLLSPENYLEGDWEMLGQLLPSRLLAWSRRFDDLPGGFGFLMAHGDEKIGGTFIFDEGRLSLAFGVSLNIPRLLGDRNFIDFSRCLLPLWPALKSAGLTVVTVDIHVQ